MGTILRRCSWKSNGVFSFQWILHRQFSASTSMESPTTTMDFEAPIAAATNSLSKPSFANFLVSSLGFTEQQALSTSTKLTKYRQSNGKKEVSGSNISSKAGLVIDLFKQEGLQKPQIRNIVCCAPQILTLKVDNNLKPKIKVFQDLGLSVSDLAEFIATCPSIWNQSLDSTILPALHVFREIMGCDEQMIRVIKALKWNSFQNVTRYLIPNVSLLQAHGIPIESIRSRLVLHPSTFILKTEVFEDVMTRVEEKWGVPPSSPMFLYAIHILVCLTEKTLDSKCEVYKSFGWTQSDVVELFRCSPFCFTISEAQIKAKLSFFMNELGYESTLFKTRYNLLLYSLEKRVVPRNVAFEVLKEKGLIKKDYPLYSAISLTESKFLERFILPFKDVVPNLYDTYVNSTAKNSPGRKDSIPRNRKLKPDGDG